MHIPRNVSLPSPSFLDVRLSGLVEGSKAAIVWAYPGGDPRRSLRGAPKGFLFLYNDGLVFLATGEADLSTGDLIDLMAGEAGTGVGGSPHPRFTELSHARPTLEGKKSRGRVPEKGGER